MSSRRTPLRLAAAVSGVLALTSCGLFDQDESAPAPRPERAAPADSRCPSSAPYELAQAPESQQEQQAAPGLVVCTDASQQQVAVVNGSHAVWVVDQPLTGVTSLPTGQPGTDVMAFRTVLGAVSWRGGTAVEPGQSVLVAARPVDVHLRLAPETGLAWSGVTLATRSMESDPLDRAGDIGQRGSRVRVAASCGLAAYRSVELLSQRTPTQQDWGDWVAKATSAGQSGSGCWEADQERRTLTRERILRTAQQDEQWRATTTRTVATALDQPGALARLCRVVAVPRVPC